MSDLKTQALLMEVEKAKAEKAKKAKSEEAEIMVFLHHGDKVINTKTGEEYTISDYNDKQDNSNKERNK